MAKPRAPWTKPEDEVIEKLHKAGRTYDDATRVLKSRSREAIRARALSIGKPLSGPLPEIDFEEFKRLMRGA